MIIGNPSSIQLLTTCIDNFLNNKKGNQQPFFILSGPKNIGKSSLVQELIKERLGQFFYSDFLYIKDLSEVLGKKHNLKIDTPEEDEKYFIQMVDGKLLDKKEDKDIDPSKIQTYEDIGIRQINHRLQQSPAGICKVVLIENLERIIPAAANAFLKTLEEPLKDRIIIATVGHQSQLLDTIISRGLVIRFQELSDKELLQFAQEHHLWDHDLEFQKFACTMAMGRPGGLINLHKNLSENPDLQNNFQKLIKLLSNPGSIFEKQDILTQLHKAGALDTFLDGWISYCITNGLSDQGAKRLKIKKMLNSNVGIEHLLLYGVL